MDRAAARGVGVGVGVGEGGKEVIGWKEVLFGRKGGVGVGESEWEKRDLENGEWFYIYYFWSVRMLCLSGFVNWVFVSFAVRKEIEASGSSERS